ncbi:MAG: peptidase U32 family protein [Candidatus Omnitrophota bacterium]
MFELNTSIFTLDELISTDISAYDAVYLGDPFCAGYPENLIYNRKDLEKAVKILRENKKRAYVSSNAVPRNDDLSKVKEALAISSEVGVDAVEAHNLGVLRMIKESFPKLNIHMGYLANIYTLATVLKLKEEGVRRFIANYELSLDELGELKDECGLEVELLLHGKMILGISEDCLSKKWVPEPSAPGNCRDLCRNGPSLSSQGMTLHNFGRLTLSGRDVCMIEHLPSLLEKGFSCFKLETFGEDREYAAAVAKIYREALSAAKDADYNPQKYIRLLEKYSTDGFCNGYYFSTSGQEYVSKG